ncbi:MAG TPA: hypothetical protein VGR78_16610 [Verrucomicrobiae bacterium]|jgi:hypothetical protein|nr:hypothetical protein [Verrucomicrobiae bacterium]
MSDKQLALKSIANFPDNASLNDIAERLEFLAAIGKGDLTRLSAGKQFRMTKLNGS